MKPVWRAPDAPLSPRQREVAKLAAAGAHGGEIASMLGLSRETARTHLRPVYRKLGVTSRGELARVVGSD
jgi:DNA-binding CsgD family transcriptional regulator